MRFHDGDIFIGHWFDWGYVMKLVKLDGEFMFMECIMCEHDVAETGVVGEYEIDTFSNSSYNYINVTELVEEMAGA